VSADAQELHSGERVWCGDSGHSHQELNFNSGSQKEEWSGGTLNQGLSISLSTALFATNVSSDQVYPTGVFCREE
jgi:hypothetical protein